MILTTGTQDHEIKPNESAQSNADSLKNMQDLGQHNGESSDGVSSENDIEESEVDSSNSSIEEDDDEEALRKVGEGFIVDDNDAEEENDEIRKSKANRRPKRREQEDDLLDEEDIALVLENSKEENDHKYKRLKRRKAEELNKIFSDDENGYASEAKTEYLERTTNRSKFTDEFADFIEEDEFSDEDKQEENREIADFVTDFQPEKFGISAEDAEEIFEIFGDGLDYAFALEDEEDEEADTQVLFYDLFDPTELAEKLLTDEDEIIRVTDIPERFQLKVIEISVDAEEECNWIQKNIFDEYNISTQISEMVHKAIVDVLRFFHQEALEVPFIWQHRRDFLIKFEKSAKTTTAVQLLTLDMLWRIFELSCAFRSLQLRKEAVRKQLQDLGIQINERLSELDQCQTMNEISNFLDCFRFNNADLVSFTSNESRRKRPSKSNFAIEARQKPIYNIVKSFSIPVELFANSVKENTKLSYPEDVNIKPDALANQFIGASLPSADDCLLFARRIIVEELFHNLSLRNSFKDLYISYGVISTLPTESGISKVDQEHPYYRVKYLLDCPIKYFEEHKTDLLSIVKAEEEGLLIVSFKLGKYYQSLLENFGELLNSDQYSDIATSWNEQRLQILDGLFRRMEPLCSKIALEVQCGKFRNNIWNAVRAAAFARFDQAPYMPPNFEFRNGEVARVLAISSEKKNGFRNSIYSVMVDEEGAPIDTLRTADFLENELKFVDFIKRHKPDLIGLSGFSVNLNKLYANLEVLVQNLDSKIPVIWVNDEVARFYLSNEEAQKEFPDLVNIERYCVALARYVQNPLLEYIFMGSNITSIEFHPDQKYLSNESLTWAIETALIDVVNISGVDLSQAIKNPRVRNMVQYISGLGPRKAKSIIKKIVALGGLDARTDLVTKQVVPKNIFMNCTSFFRIISDVENGGDILDSTRIHNEDYDLAKKMAADALELDEEDIEEYEENSGVVLHLISNEETDKLDDLVLEEYADQLEATFGHLKRTILPEIREELKNPYREKRSNFKKLSKDQIFEMMTGESSQKFAPGVIVPCVIRKLTKSYMFLSLDCGLEGNVVRQEFPDIIQNQLRIGQIVDACILRVNKSRFTVDLTLRESALQEARNNVSLQVKSSPYWNKIKEQADRKKNIVKAEESNFVRVIKHPLFKKFSAKQAVEYLNFKKRGDIVIRPSHLGNNHITVTWKLADGIVQHLDVQEFDKDNEFSVGKTLKIGDKYTYSDLDELLVTHIKAMLRKVDEMLHHEKFQSGSRKDVNKWLERYSEANPRRSVYAFCFNREHPGYFDLCFKTNIDSKVYSWPVKVIPNAFEIQKHIYADMNTLCNGFKILYGTIQNDKQRERYRR